MFIYLCFNNNNNLQFKMNHENCSNKIEFLYKIYVFILLIKKSRLPFF
jgi:hypothetical protein